VARVVGELLSDQSEDEGAREEIAFATVRNEVAGDTDWRVIPQDGVGYDDRGCPFPWSQIGRYVEDHRHAAAIEKHVAAQVAVNEVPVLSRSIETIRDPAQDIRGIARQLNDGF